MSEKKGFFSSLFGGNKSGGCCNMDIIEEETGCDCGEVCCEKPAETEKIEANRDDILILGPGCKKCQSLEQNVKEALKKTGRDAEITHVTDFGEIASYGIMNTPGLVIKGKAVAYGKVLKVNEIIELLEKNL